ncbi:hypothetical protein COU49_02485 [Candidatus Nomurabacteria bacterium CG10_big_fil_rev_8_21_14_0_10_35_16]|uniref:Uncharacterized protein n=1 Tax=Candidatus Nomurabacteria bacterium CG10_big_fil_rev_8_21_14_0_10_35_16 TaxID=1974731 RepID=A0A2H0TAY3_9BACT|nr:MAG: hypothetical protein COU49_02485 [Candidatus Nomurabacteria bacterium CG10_big_fil_rev_8_21_14_0_10_35_16]
MNVYLNTGEVCKEYDKINGITKVIAGQEHKSLEWLYNFIYRFTSGSIHQVLESKESVLDLLWINKTYTSENAEVLGLLLVLLNEIKDLNKST